MAVASSTAVRSEPPRPSDAIAPPARTPRNPGTITVDALRIAARRRCGRTEMLPFWTRPVWCTLKGTAVTPRRCRCSASNATDRISPVDHRRSSAAASGGSAIDPASSRRASVCPYCADTITTRRSSGDAVSRSARNRATAAYEAVSRNTDPPIFNTTLLTRALQAGCATAARSPIATKHPRVRIHHASIGDSRGSGRADKHPGCRCSGPQSWE